MLYAGTWQSFIVKDHSVWHKISKDSPMEYAATIIVNPLTALRMLEDFTALNSGAALCFISIFHYFFYFFFLINRGISRRFYRPKWCNKHCGAVHNSDCTASWYP